MVKTDGEEALADNQLFVKKDKGRDQKVPSLLLILICSSISSEGIVPSFPSSRSVDTVFRCPRLRFRTLSCRAFTSLLCGLEPSLSSGNWGVPSHAGRAISCDQKLEAAYLFLILGLRLRPKFLGMSKAIKSLL